MSCMGRCEKWCAAVFGSKTLSPKSRAARITAIEMQPGSCAPPAFFVLPDELFRDGRKDDAAFWFDFVACQYGGNGSGRLGPASTVGGTSGAQHPGELDWCGLSCPGRTQGYGGRAFLVPSTCVPEGTVNTHIRIIATSSLIAIVAACGSGGLEDSGEPRGWEADVSILGTVREVLRDGKTGARAELADLRGDPTFFAVGALAGLEGEYTIDRGEVWTTRALDGDVVTASGADAEGGAAMVLSAHVAAWSEYPVERDVDPSELPDYIRAAAVEHGLDATQPFPFLVSGALSHLDAHVIAGDCPMRARMLGRAVEPPPFQVSEASVEGRIVGFYAEGRAGEITHHGASVHAHVLLDGARPLTAHVESVGLRAGAVLRLPSR